MKKKISVDLNEKAIHLLETKIKKGYEYMFMFTDPEDITRRDLIEWSINLATMYLEEKGNFYTDKEDNFYYRQDKNTAANCIHYNLRNNK